MFSILPLAVGHRGCLVIGSRGGEFWLLPLYFILLWLKTQRDDILGLLNDLVSALDGWQQVDISIDNEGSVGRRSFIPAFHLQDGGFTQVWVQAKPKRPLVAFVGIQFNSFMGDGGEGEGEAVVVHGEILHGPNGTSRFPEVTVQSLDCMQFDFVPVPLDVRRNLGGVLEVAPEASND